jgi:hypothetical protein
LVVLLAACSRPAASPPPFDAAPPAAIQATIAIPPVDAGPKALPGGRLVALIDEMDGGAMDLTLPDASIPAKATLHFETSAPLSDFRIRVLTSDDRLVENHANIVVDDGGTQVLVKPLHAWPSRACCVFRIDGETDRLPSGETEAYLPYELAFSVEPDPNAKPSPTKRAPHRHRHRR